MITIPEFAPESHRRTHPWTVTEYDDDNDVGQYYNFKQRPELIATSLEDFFPHSNRAAIQHFYRFLEWVNRPSGLFETNDCAFRPPEEHEDILFRKKFRLSGRLQFFYRNLKDNVSRESVVWINRMLHIYLSTYGRDENFIVFETSIQPTDYVEIGALGSRISLRFCAYDDTEDSCFDCFHRAVVGLQFVFSRLESAMSGQVPEYP